MSFSILVLVISLLLSFESYGFYISLLFSVLVVFVFSSGIIIIFCYCAILSYYEEKNKNLFGIIYSFLLLLLIINYFFFVSYSNIRGGSWMGESYVGGLLFFTILVIVLLLKGINILMSNPLKGFIDSY